jgi:hypothetical protein
VQTQPIAQDVALVTVTKLGRRRWAAPLAAATAVVMTAGVSAALTVSRIDHRTAAAAGARLTVASAHTVQSPVAGARR